MPENPYSSQTIAGYNASPPSDDGAQTSANQLEWDKHIQKIGDPIKTLAEAIDTAVNNAFNDLIITTDIAEETAIVGYDRFSNNRAVIELMFGNIKNRLTTLESSADTHITSDNNVVAVEMLGNPHTAVAEMRFSRLAREDRRIRDFVVEGESAIVAADVWR